MFLKNELFSELFARLDTDHDGVVTRQAILSLLIRSLESRSELIPLYAFIKQLRISSVKRFTMTEFLQFIDSVNNNNDVICSNYTDQSVKYLFNRIKDNNEEAISEKSLEKWVNALNIDLSSEQIKLLLKHESLLFDNRINLNEFAKILNGRLKLNNV